MLILEISGELYSNSRLKLQNTVYIMERNRTFLSVFAFQSRKKEVRDYERERRGVLMKKYNKNGQLETLICNCCGKKLAVDRGIIREGAISIDHPWDYFSEKDGQIHHFDLCEECYDQIISGFRIPVSLEELKEYL